ncbi:uncharacterized protein LOC116160298 [Photinus pyralis]|uniref:uncharacterized protein LOC116160298 n=1 Tax=Photinus pyralis TaxID=7054 RepID=UPI00126779C8|nr:uncharacterized protein LOC116160298 [Photinus pyralis]
MDLTVTNEVPPSTSRQLQGEQSQPLDLTVKHPPLPSAPGDYKPQSQPLDLCVKHPPQPSVSSSHAKPKRKRAAPCVNNILNPQPSTSGLQPTTPIVPCEIMSG